MKWTVTVEDSGEASTALSKARLMWKIEGERLVFDAWDLSNLHLRCERASWDCLGRQQGATANVLGEVSDGDVRLSILFQSFYAALFLRSTEKYHRTGRRGLDGLRSMLLGSGIRASRTRSNSELLCQPVLAVSVSVPVASRMAGRTRRQILKGEFDGECVIFVDINAVCHKLN